MEPDPTTSPTPAWQGARLELVRAGIRKGGLFGWTVWVEYTNVGQTQGYVYEDVYEGSLVRKSIGSFKVRDAEGFTIGEGVFDMPFPKVVPPGGHMYMFSDVVIDQGHPAKVVMGDAPDFRDLGDKDALLDVLEVKVSRKQALATIVNRTSTAFPYSGAVIVWFDGKGRPMDGELFEPTDFPVPFEPGEKVRVSDDLTYSTTGWDSYKVFAEASWFKEPNF